MLGSWMLVALVVATPILQAGVDTRPATLVDGITGVHHPIQTRSQDAQRFFDQGLAFVYACNRDEAVRSFRRAAELDPTSPMPWWGIALALGPHVDRDIDAGRARVASEAIRRGVELSPRAPANERAYVAALAKRYSSDALADLQALAVQYKDALRALMRTFPADMDAATLYAESLMDLQPELYASDGTPAEGTIEIIDVLENVLRREPDHVGANHYYIHATEASLAPDRALASARRLETLVPAAGHLLHMPAHTYMRTGNYAGAVKATVRAAEADRKYLEETRNAGPRPALRYTHHLDALASAAMMTGQFAEATKAADQVAQNAAAAAGDMPMLERIAAKKMFVLLRFARWGEVLALPAPDARAAVATALHHFARGVAHAKLGAVQDADRERDAYHAARQRVQDGAAIGANPASAVLAVADATLDARIAAARGDLTGAIESWQKAVAAEDILAYDEPAGWYYPSRESLGAAYIQADRPNDARRTYREDLERNPGNPRSLFGLWQAYIQTEPGSRMSQSLRIRFRDAWTDADVQLTLSDF